MKDLVKYINDFVLVKVAQLNSVNLSVRILAGILTSKAIAVFIGVEGMALIGNIRNFVSASQSFAIMGMYKGLVHYVSKFKNNSFRLSETLSTAYYIGFFATILLSFSIYLNADTLNQFLFSDNYNFAYIIKIFSLALPFYAINMFCFSILNGFSKYKILLIINIIGQVLGLGITLVLIYQNNIDGALIAAVIAPSLVFLITLIGIINRKSFVSLINIRSANINMIRRFAPFVVMAGVSAIAIPLVMIFIRNYIIDNIGLKQAGFWEAMNRISDYYLMFINSLLALYIIPKFSEIKAKEKLKEELVKLYKTVLPILGIGIVVIFILKGLIVRIVFTAEFLPTKDLFFWQLLGDFVKVFAMILAYQFIAKKMFLHFVIIELFLVIILYLSSVFFIDIFGLQGAVVGHFFSYLLQLGIILLIFNNSIFNVISESPKPPIE